MRWPTLGRGPRGLGGPRRGSLWARLFCRTAASASPARLGARHAGARIRLVGGRAGRRAPRRWPPRLPARLRRAQRLALASPRLSRRRDDAGSRARPESRTGRGGRRRRRRARRASHRDRRPGRRRAARGRVDGGDDRSVVPFLSLRRAVPRERAGRARRCEVAGCGSSGCDHFTVSFDGARRRHRRAFDWISSPLTVLVRSPGDHRVGGSFRPRGQPIRGAQRRDSATSGWPRRSLATRRLSGSRCDEPTAPSTQCPADETITASVNPDVGTLDAISERLATARCIAHSPASVSEALPPTSASRRHREAQPRHESPTGRRLRRLFT
jgi:hypothetical protein